MRKYAETSVSDAERRRADAFKARLRLAAADRGLGNLSELARVTGVAPSTLRKYFAGTRLPSAVSLIRFSRELRVPIDWLLGAGEEDMLIQILHARELEGKGKVGQAK